MNPLHLTAALCLSAWITAAADKPAEPQEFKHRVTGLFAPDREADLGAALEKIPAVKLVRLDFNHAEAVFSYDPVVAFKGTKPEKIVERFNEILRNASRHTIGIAPLDPTPKDKLTRIEIPVFVLDCKACSLAAYETVYKIDGVAAATAEFKQSRVTALIDTNRTDRAAIEAALKKRDITVKKPAP
jgi:copper chaperone CopZ